MNECVKNSVSTPLTVMVGCPFASSDGPLLVEVSGCSMLPDGTLTVVACDEPVGVSSPVEQVVQ